MLFSRGNNHSHHSHRDRIWRPISIEVGGWACARERVGHGGREHRISGVCRVQRASHTCTCTGEGVVMVGWMRDGLVGWARAHDHVIRGCLTALRLCWQATNTRKQNTYTHLRVSMCTYVYRMCPTPADPAQVYSAQVGLLGPPPPAWTTCTRHCFCVGKPRTHAD